jgi:hypothetical protein
MATHHPAAVVLAVGFTQSADRSSLKIHPVNAGGTREVAASLPIPALMAARIECGDGHIGSRKHVDGCDCDLPDRPAEDVIHGVFASRGVVAVMGGPTGSDAVSHNIEPCFYWGLLRERTGHHVPESALFDFEDDEELHRNPDRAPVRHRNITPDERDRLSSYAKPVDQNPSEWKRRELIHGWFRALKGTE